MQSSTKQRGQQHFDTRRLRDEGEGDVGACGAAYDHDGRREAHARHFLRRCNEVTSLVAVWRERALKSTWPSMACRTSPTEMAGEAVALGDPCTMPVTTSPLVIGLQLQAHASLLRQRARSDSSVDSSRSLSGGGRHTRCLLQSGRCSS